MNDVRTAQFVTSTLYANRRLRSFMQTATLIAQRTVYEESAYDGQLALQFTLIVLMTANHRERLMMRAHARY